MDINGASVLVTGASGFVDPHLIDTLCEKDAQIKILSLREGNISLNYNVSQCAIIRGDITEPRTFEGITKGVDFVFHLAAIANVDYAINNPIKTYDVNVRGTLNLLEEVRKNPVQKFVYVSSSHIYGVPQYLPLDEKHPITPREPYSASKATSENIVCAYSNAYGVNTAIVRPFNVYWPGQDERFLIPSILKQSFCNNVIEVGNLEPARYFTYINDVVAGFLKIAKFGSGVYNLGSEVEVKVGDVIQKVMDIINRDIEIIAVVDKQRSDEVEITQMYADAFRLKGIW